MSPRRQLWALLALRWALVRSGAVRVGLVAAGLTVPLIGWLILASRTTIEPAALTAALDAAPAAFLGFGALAVIAPLTSSAGSELIPSSQLVAYPVRPATMFLSSLVLAPVNLVWIVQIWVLTAETGYLTVGHPSLALGALTSVAYVLACTCGGQTVAWVTVGLRRSRRGRLSLRLAFGMVVASVIALVRLGYGHGLVDRSFAPAVVHGVRAGGRQDISGWLPVTALLVVAVAAALLVGGRACRWAVRRPEDLSGNRGASPVRRRATVSSPLRALVAVDRASVWRAPALRRGALVLTVLPGIAAAGAGLPWRSLIVLPGLVAAGGGLLFGFNAFCLDASGAVWLASLPHPPHLVARAKALVTAETVALGVVLVALIGSLRAQGQPTVTEAVAIVASGLTCCALVVALCLSASVRRPHRADLDGPRDAVAPPGALMLASARLAGPAAALGMTLEVAASADRWWLPLAVAGPVAAGAAAWIVLSLKRYDDPLRRSRIVQTVSAG